VKYTKAQNAAAKKAQKFSFSWFFVFIIVFFLVRSAFVGESPCKLKIQFKTIPIFASKLRELRTPNTTVTDRRS
jgi:hypothetical protein